MKLFLLIIFILAGLASSFCVAVVGRRLFGRKGSALPRSMVGDSGSCAMLNIHDPAIRAMMDGSWAGE